MALEILYSMKKGLKVQQVVWLQNLICQRPIIVLNGVFGSNDEEYEVPCKVDQLDYELCDLSSYTILLNGKLGKKLHPSRRLRRVILFVPKFSICVPRV